MSNPNPSSDRTDLKLKARDILELARFEPVKFQEVVLGIKHQPWQRKLTEAVFDVVRKRYGKPTRVNHEGKNFITVRAMHGPGKTYGLGALIHTFGVAFPKARIPCIAPKMDQLRTRLWFELRKIADSARADYRSCIDIQATTLKFFGHEDWLAFAQTATKAENLAGLHHDFMLILVDEASGVTESLWPTIFGAAAGGKVVILVMVSNPTKNVGTFAESWLKVEGSENYFRFPIKLEDVDRPGHREWVEAMARKYGVASPIYKIRCLGEFADSGENQLLATQWIMDARERDAEGAIDGSIPRLRVTVDVADGGVDETTILAMRHYATRRLALKQTRHSWPASLAPIEAAKAAAAVFDGWGGNRKNGDDIVVDSLGVGAGTAGWLIEKGYPVVQYKGGESSDDPLQWRNRRVQSYIALRNDLRDGTAYFSPALFDDPNDWEDLMAQLASIQINPGTERVEDLLTKEEMRRRGIKSPDMADGFAMQYATQQPYIARTPVTVETIENMVVRRSSALEGWFTP